MKMKKILLMLMLTVFAAISYAAVPEVSVKTKIVVLPFKDMSNTQLNAGEKISSFLAGRLAQMGRFEIVDRTELEKVLEEQKLSMAGVVDSEQSVEVGKIAGAKLAFTGNIVSLNLYREEIEKKEKAKENEGLGAMIVKEIVKSAIKEEKQYKKEWNASIVINVKVLDVETGTILKSFTQEAKYTTTDVHTREAAADAVVRIAGDNSIGSMKELFAIKSYIFAKEGQNAMIRLGQDIGIQRDMEFYIYTPSKIITDKISNTEMKVSGDRIGLLYVTNVNKDSANVRIVKGAYKVEDGAEIKEKMFPSINIDVGGGVAPFNISKSSINKQFGYQYGINKASFEIDMKQEARKDAPYINLNIGPAYKEVKPTVDLYMLLNSPISAAGLDLNLEFSKDLFEIIELSAGAGIGGRIGFGNIGTVKVSTVSSATTWDIIFNTGTNIKDGADISVSGASFDLKAKGKMTINLSDSMSLFGEGGYVLSKIDSWEMKTKDINDADIKLGNIAVGSLDMTGVYFGGGLRFTF